MDSASLRSAIDRAKRDLCSFDGKDRAISELLISAAEKHLATLPQTREVETWHVEYARQYGDGWFAEIEGALCDSRTAAAVAESLRLGGAKCVRVTGPHRQQVPA